MSSDNFNFQNLLPEIILDSLWDAGIRVDSGLTPLNSYENRVWQFSDENKCRYVVKFYRPQRWNEAQLLEEHQLTRELADSDIPTASPLLLNGHTLQRVNGYYFTIFPALGGRQFEIDNYDHLEQVARYLGRIHQIGRKRLFDHRLTISFDEYFSRSVETLSESALIPVPIRNDFFHNLQQLGKILQQVWHTDWQPLRLHGDCHASNILWRDGPLFVDWDDSRNGPAIQDLWMLVNGNEQEQRLQWDILLEAYSEFAEFNDNELSLIEPLRTMRIIYYLAWVVNRWHDPAFPAAFPWFNDPQFWHQQLTIFSKQAKRLLEPPLLFNRPYY